MKNAFLEHAGDPAKTVIEGFSQTEESAVKEALNRQSNKLKPFEQIDPRSDDKAQLGTVETALNDIQEKERILEATGGSAGSQRLQKMEKEIKQQKTLVEKIYSYIQHRNNKSQN